MKLSSATLILSFAGSIFASNIKSKPFVLKVSSHNATYNDNILNTCHEGAAIEALCPAKITAPLSEYSNFTFVYPSAEVVSKEYGPAGSIFYELPFAGGQQKEGLGIFPDPSTNVAFLQFFPGNNFYQWAFDPKDRLNVQTYYNDTANPPTTAAAVGYYRFYLCQVDYTGYQYVQLSYVFGEYPPQNPTCVHVTVKREFLS